MIILGKSIEILRKSMKILRKSIEILRKSMKILKKSIKILRKSTTIGDVVSIILHNPKEEEDRPPGLRGAIACVTLRISCVAPAH